MTKREVESWVADIAGHPAAVRWCDGSESGAEEIAIRLLALDDCDRLDANRFPRSFPYRSHPSDVARTENRAFIGASKAGEACPTNNWMSPDEAARGAWPHFMHSSESRTSWSIGSGYRRNALLSKKCHALRIASIEARDEGWPPKHMMIIGLTRPSGENHYVAAAFPSACGKTNRLCSSIS